MKRLAYFIVIAAFVLSTPLSAQRKITFLASDGLEVTADLYMYDAGAPYIILLHQENSSRGEYREIAPRLQRMGFNCLAVDLRSGRESNFVQNETAALAQRNNVPATNLDSEKDIRAAIAHIERTTNISRSNRHILFGSSFSASLAMKVASQNRNVAAVIAFSPGEFFRPLTVKDWFKDFNHMVYITHTRREAPFVTELINEIPANLITQFQPSGEGRHGASALWNDHPQASEIWMSLMLFINRVKEERYR